MKWLDRYRTTQISIARDQLRSGRGSTAARNNVQGRLQRLESKQRQKSGRSAWSGRLTRGETGSSREVRDLRLALKRYDDNRPGADRDLSRAMLRLQRQIGRR